MYRFKTFKTTYYFPALTDQTKFIYSLYGNYGGRGAHLLWWLFTHSRLFRWLNRVAEGDIEDYKLLTELLGSDSVFGISLGSKGPDQKKSILGYEKRTGKRFFAKLSTKKRAKDLTRNEIKVYQTLAGTGLVPKLYTYKDEDGYVFLKCECITGSHVHGQIDNRQIMDMLQTLKHCHYKELSTLRSERSDACLSKTPQLSTFNFQLSTTPSCFAHMDFCPWNMIDVGGELHIIDWEMAAEMPLGFDLFTYLLQTYFLTDNVMTGEEVVKANEPLITEYFDAGRDEWQPYLNMFIDWKIHFFSAGQNDLLLHRFQEMKNQYALCSD